MADRSSAAAERLPQEPEEEDEAGKKRKRKKEAATPEKKPFRLSDYTLKTAHIHYKQLRVDEEQRWGQVCSCDASLHCPDCQRNVLPICHE